MAVALRRESLRRESRRKANHLVSLDHTLRFFVAPSKEEDGLRLTRISTMFTAGSWRPFSPSYAMPMPILRFSPDWVKQLKCGPFLELMNLVIWYGFAWKQLGEAKMKKYLEIR
ncbi:OLC1v1012522C1 [Oldenlandia corymbosa var. corymbosa]|uniref:OLC1v1012522C1 n=1 Tax=Oldenlandia corymbosa var. corymbosa TaxID=529605 RepID=A0AAV1DZ48_OLDCO|nr:OLC1v1012522C1 [Oldenlandia corymbosa var. corymbosa]